MKFRSCYRVALINQNTGYVGVIDNDIRVCTDPDYQGLGMEIHDNEIMNI